MRCRACLHFQRAVNNLAPILFALLFDHGIDRIQLDGGFLSNSEVISVLREREANKQAVVSKAQPSEIKVRWLHVSSRAGCALQAWLKLTLEIRPPTAT